jgi:hypothetical protein
MTTLKLDIARDLVVGIRMLRDVHSILPQPMKIFFRVFAAALCTVAGIALADDFKSVVITGGGPVDLPRIHGDQFMVIRNFTQDTPGATRGVVMVTKPPSSVTPVNVLAAAILDPSMSPEVINSVVIAGPADVKVTCDPSAICFISFKKDGN